MKPLHAVLLSGLVVWQGWALWQTIHRQYDLLPVAPARAWQPGVTGTQSITSQPRPAGLDVIVSDAVFSPTRKLTVPPTPVAAKPPPRSIVTRPVRLVRTVPNPTAPKPPELLLEGVLLSLSQEMALIRAAGTDDRKWLRLDQSFKGWTLIAIMPNEVLLEAGDAQRKVPLYVDSK